MWRYSRKWKEIHFVGFWRISTFTWISARSTVHVKVMEVYLTTLPSNAEKFSCFCQTTLVGISCLSKIFTNLLNASTFLSTNYPPKSLTSLQFIKTKQKSLWVFDGVCNKARMAFSDPEGKEKLNPNITVAGKIYCNMNTLDCPYSINTFRRHLNRGKHQFWVR